VEKDDTFFGNELDKVTNVDLNQGKDVNEIAKKNAQKESYSDWEAQIIMLPSLASLQSDDMARKRYEAGITLLLGALKNLKGYDKEYEQFRDRQSNLPKLYNVKTSKIGGEDYSIMDLNTNDIINIPKEMYSMVLAEIYKKQFAMRCDASWRLFTDLYAFLRNEANYFAEDKLFNVNDFFKSIMTEQATPSGELGASGGESGPVFPSSDSLSSSSGDRDSWQRKL